MIGDVILFVFCHFWQGVIGFQDWQSFAEKLERLRLDHLTEKIRINVKKSFLVVDLLILFSNHIWNKNGDFVCLSVSVCLSV
jgi:hypothetical protein